MQLSLTFSVKALPAVDSGLAILDFGCSFENFPQILYIGMLCLIRSIISFLFNVIPDISHLKLHFGKYGQSGFLD